MVLFCLVLLFCLVAPPTTQFSFDSFDTQSDEPIFDPGPTHPCVLDSWRSVPICLGLRLLRWTTASATPTRLRVVACSRGRCGMTTIAQDCALGGALQWRRLSSGTPE